MKVFGLSLSIFISASNSLQDSFMCFLCSVTLEFTVSFFEWTFTQAWIPPSSVDHVENTGPVTYVDDPNVGHFCKQYQNILFVNITADQKNLGFL